MTTATSELIIDRRANSPQEIRDLTVHMREMEVMSHDYVVPGRALTMTDEGTVAFSLGQGPLFAGFDADMPLLRHAHGGLASAIDMPQKYYDRLLAADKPLLARNVNRWLHGTDDDPSKITNRLVRTIGGNVRAILSDRFFPIDAVPLFFSILRTVRDNGVEIRAVHLTEKYFTIEMTKPGTEVEIHYRERDEGGIGNRRPDMLVPYVTVRTSDVGASALSVAFGGKRLACWNGAITDRAFVQRHLGSQLPVGILGADTVKASSEAIILEARDMVYSCFDPAKFASFVNAAEEATGFFVDQPIEAVKLVASTYKLSDDEMDAMLAEFVHPSTDVNPGLTLWGAVNAVTWLSHNASGDRRYELEQIGGQMLSEGARVLAPVLRR